MGCFMWSSWLRHWATSRKVAGSIPDGVNLTFHWYNLTGRTMFLGPPQSVTEMSTRNISWVVKDGRYLGLTTLPPSCADCLEIWEPQPPGPRRACNRTVQKLLYVFFWVIPRRLNFICRRFGTLCPCCETSAYKIQTPGNYPEENIQYTENSESLSSSVQGFL
jgi:hypothetical protein